MITEETKKTAQDFANLTGQFTPEQIQAMVKTGIIAPGAKGHDLELFLYACREMGANPITKQMYMLSRVGKKKDAMGRDILINGNPETEIKFHYICDYKFLMAKADMTGQWGGHSEFTYDDGRTLTEFDPLPATPKVARVTVYRLYPNGQRAEATGEALWSEYGGNSPIWRGNPFTMLGKVAMRKAVTGAFPAATQGMYIEEEFARETSFQMTARSLPQSTGAVEIPDDAFYELEAATTPEELTTIAKSMKQYNNNPDWISAVTKRRNELQEVKP